MQSMDIEAGTGKGAAPAKPARPTSPRDAAATSPKAAAAVSSGGGGSGNPDVRTVIRESLGFRGAVELILLLSIANIIFSIACAAALSKGWFVARSGGDGSAFRVIVNTGWAEWQRDLTGNGDWIDGPMAIDSFSDGAEAMGSLTFIGHLTSIFLSLAVIVFIYYMIAYGTAGRLGSHRTQARFLAMALIGLGSYLFCFSIVGFPAAIERDFEESTEYVDENLHPDWAWGLSFLVTLFTFVTGGILMRAGNKIDDTLAAAAGL